MCGVILQLYFLLVHILEGRATLWFSLYSMKCKCSFEFCWKCLMPWSPTHSDYYNCSSKVWMKFIAANILLDVLIRCAYQIGKAAHDQKKFADVNQRSISHHKSKVGTVPCRGNTM